MRGKEAKRRSWEEGERSDPFRFECEEERSLEDTGDMVVTEGLPCWGRLGNEQKLELWKHQPNSSDLSSTEQGEGEEGRRGRKPDLSYGLLRRKWLTCCQAPWGSLTLLMFGLFFGLLFSFITFIDHLLCSRHCVRFWKYTGFGMTYLEKTNWLQFTGTSIW